jgi:hypothetical protein
MRQRTCARRARQAGPSLPRVASRPEPATCREPPRRPIVASRVRTQGDPARGLCAGAPAPRHERLQQCVSARAHPQATTPAQLGRASCDKRARARRQVCGRAERAGQARSWRQGRPRHAAAIPTRDEGRARRDSLVHSVRADTHGGHVTQPWQAHAHEAEHRPPGHDSRVQEIAGPARLPIFLNFVPGNGKGTNALSLSPAIHDLTIVPDRRSAIANQTAAMAS